MTNALKRIRGGFLEEMSARFANRPISGKLGWLDVSKWPVDATLQSYGVQELQTIFEHWKKRLLSMTWQAVLQKFDQMNVVYKTALKLVDSRVFLKDIINAAGHRLPACICCSDAHLHWPRVMPWWSKHFRDLHGCLLPND